MTEIATHRGLAIMAFTDLASLERWIEGQSSNVKGVWLRFVKKGVAIPSVTAADALDVALCHGWIDGQAQPWEEGSYLLRFTPRRAKSNWSAINRARVLTLIELGRMRPAGMAAIEAAKADGRWTV